MSSLWRMAKQNKPKALRLLYEPCERFDSTASIRRVAGVPDTAMHFAYVHPPCGLAEDIGWDDFEMQPLCIDP